MAAPRRRHPSSGERHLVELTGPAHVLTGTEPRLTRVDVQAVDEA
jgi:hypothetical protein